MISLYRADRLPVRLARQVVTNDIGITFATAGELWKWAVTKRWRAARRGGLDLWLSARRVIPANLAVAQVWAWLMTAAQLNTWRALPWPPGGRENPGMGERRSWIPMEDGVRLAVSLFLPESGEPAPVVLEALPYRKDDATASYRPEYERLCEEYGYAVARVDLRGTGSSEGTATDEYPASEQADLCQVIEWLAGQPWSTGAVGMYGTSYSGFNSLQVAAERPPALKAIIAIYASDDRYTDDVHYTGGTLKLLDLVDYPLYMVALNALPPVPAVAGPGWRERWRERVEGLEPWLLRWLEEQADGPYWRQGSLRPDYERIACPTMLVAGWADGYRNATFRVLERLRAPARLLFGPWSHMATDTSRPGPRIDLVPEMVRWWDRWLRGERNGVDQEPPVTVFVRHSSRPAPDLDEQPGTWRDEPAWPPDRATTRTLPLSGAAPAEGGADRLEVRPDVGSTAWISCAGHLPFGQPDDQRTDDAYSLTYDWELDQELEILGHPRLVVRVGASAPVAFLSAKLCDVFPDGTSALVARGFLNLTQRRSRTEPEPMRPGVTETVGLELDATSWVFPAGHRLRLSLAGSDWPNLVPPPGPVTLTVERDGSALTLPVLEGPSPSPPPSLPRPRPPAKADGGDDDPPVGWRVVRDVLGHRTEAEIDHGGRTELPDGAALTERYQGTVGAALDRPGLAWARGSAAYRIEWPEATVTTTARLHLEIGADAFEVQLDLEAREGGEVRWTRSWHRRIPRHLA